MGRPTVQIIQEDINSQARPFISKTQPQTLFLI